MSLKIEEEKACGWNFQDWFLSLMQIDDTNMKKNCAPSRHTLGELGWNDPLITNSGTAFFINSLFDVNFVASKEIST